MTSISLNERLRWLAEWLLLIPPVAIAVSVFLGAPSLVSFVFTVVTALELCVLGFFAIRRKSILEWASCGIGVILCCILASLL